MNSQIARVSVLCGALLTVGATASVANQYNYTGPDGGNWSTAANWTLNGGSTHQVPVTGDDAVVGLALSVSSVNFNAVYSGAGLNSLTLDSPGHTSITLNQVNSGTAMIAVTETIGKTVTQNYYVQSAGTNTVSSILSLGEQASSSGAYTLNSGSLAVAGFEEIGNSGTGIFNQSGGTNTVSVNGLFVGGNSGASGTYNLSGTGALITTGIGSVEHVGYLGNGTFNQFGGTNTSSADLNLGEKAGFAGTYTLSGGFATISGNTYVGGGAGFSGGTGVLTVSGAGVLTVAGTLTAYNTGGTVINLNGARINAGGLDFNGAASLLNWTNGTLNLTNNVVFDSGAASTSTSNAFGPALTLGANQTFMVTGNETLGGAGSFSLTLNSGSSHYVTGSITLSPTGIITQNSGSSLYYSSFTQSGGTVNGTLQNQGFFTYQSGLFNGRLLNQGAVNFGPSFTAGNGVENDTTINLPAGQTLIVNGMGLDNLGLFVFNGGTLSGSGPVLNDLGGTMQGHGIVNPAITNNGVLTVGGVLKFNGGVSNYGLIQGSGTVFGGLSNTSAGSITVAAGSLLAINNAWTNSGLVALQGAGAVLNGGAITNSRTINGNGNIGSAVTNNGTIAPLGGLLYLSGTLTNSANGLIRVSAGNEALVTQGLAANAGIINLIGGTFDNDGFALSNTGQISGYGNLATGGTGLDNNGSITFTGGTTTVNGPVTNENLKTIVVAYNPAIFTGLVTNTGTGTFNVISTTVTFAGGSSGNVPPGAFTNSPAAAFAKAGSGALEVDGPPTLGNSSSLAVNDTGALRFKAISGSATVGTGVTVTVNNAATLELAGSVSALSAGSNRVNIVNNSSAAAGILVSGINQQVGNIDGGGKTQVNAGSDLTANHIIQSALIIGGTASSHGLVTIDPSDPSGNPLAESASQSSGAGFASSLESSAPFGGGASISSTLLPLGAEGFSGDPIPAGSHVDANVGGSGAAVPEPSTIVLLAFGSVAWVWHVVRRRTSQRA